MLDDASLEVLNRLGKCVTKSDQFTDAYNELASELRDFLNAFVTWVRVRRQLDDENAWERSLTETDPPFKFLKVVKSDRQRTRVYA